MKKMLLIFFVLILVVVISLVYNTLPRLELNGSRNLVISYRDEYQDPGVIVKNANNDYIGKVVIENNINTEILGDYHVDYSLKIGKKTLFVRRNVKVIDDIAPIVKLKGNQIVEVSLNDVYKELGYDAFDEYDGDLTDSVEIIGDVDTSKYGEYVLTYRVTDRSGNKVEVNRIIKVIDEEKPKIVCKTNYSAFPIGSSDIIGCKAVDNFDGDITDKVQVEGNYNVDKTGVYSVTYRVKDDAGNEVQHQHNIVIFKPNVGSKVFLTFDDGPSESTSRILDILEREDVVGTFFNEFYDKDDFQYVLMELEKGHDVGLNIKNVHTFKTFKQKVDEVQKLMYEYTGDKVKSFRFQNVKSIAPDVFNEIKDYLNKNNYAYYDYDIDTNDLFFNKDEIINSVIKDILSSDNNQITVLMHDCNLEQTIDSLPTIIGLFKDMNYEFDTISSIQFR